MSDKATCYGRGCACGKVLYASRSDARRAAKRLHPAERLLRPYHCPYADGFHIGHLGPEVIAGEATRSEVYGRRRRWS